MLLIKIILEFIYLNAFLDHFCRLCCRAWMLGLLLNFSKVIQKEQVSLLRRFSFLGSLIFPAKIFFLFYSAKNRQLQTKLRSHEKIAHVVRALMRGSATCAHTIDQNKKHSYKLLKEFVGKQKKWYLIESNME